MTGQELVTHLRESILGNIAIPYLWTDIELLRYLNYAEVQACRRAHLIIDGTTANDTGTAATAGTLGQKPLCTLSLISGQATYELSPKILQVKRCQLKSMTSPLIGPVTYSELDEFMSGWLGTSGTIHGNYDGEFATGSIVSNGTLGTVGAMVIIGTNGYTFSSSLVLENNVLIGTSGADSLDHLSSAINNGGTSALHLCSASHPLVSSTMTVLGTAGTMGITALIRGTAGNGIALSSTDVNLVVSGAGTSGTGFLTGGVEGNGTPTYFLNEPGNTITFVYEPAYSDTASLVVSRIPLTPFTLQTSPEIAEKYHEGLMDWAAHLAYLKNDPEALNIPMAKMYEDKFARQFGTLPDAYSDRMRKTLNMKQRMRPRIFGS